MNDSETNSKGRLTLVAVVAALASAILTLAIVARPDMDDDDEEEHVISAIESSHTGSVSLGELASQNGIEVALLENATAARESVVFGTVADTTDLIDLVRQDAAFAARIDAGAARSKSAAAEEARLTQLNTDDHNASDRDLEAAQTEAAAARANLDATRSERATLRAIATRRWGPLAERMLDGSVLSERVVAGRAAIIELALPPVTDAPRHIQILVPGSGSVAATLIGAVPRVDPQLQQRLYAFMSEETNLPAGLRVTAGISGGGDEDGVIIPQSAVVWSDGAAWVFVETAEGRFERHRVAATRLDERGYFETTVPAGTRVVIRGSQQLLSQQHKPEPED